VSPNHVLILKKMCFILGNTLLLPFLYGKKSCGTDIERKTIF
jgi:hypothetical protein